MDILSKKEILEKLKEENFKFAWVNTFSDLFLKEYKSYNNIEKDLNDLIEAKFFNEDIELSVMANAEGYYSVVKFDSRDKEYIEEVQRLTKHKRVFLGNKNDLVIRNYIKYDNDGQAYIYYSKLHDVRKGEVVCDEK